MFLLQMNNYCTSRFICRIFNYTSIIMFMQSNLSYVTGILNCKHAYTKCQLVQVNAGHSGQKSGQPD